MKEWLIENLMTIIGYLFTAGLGTWIFVDRKKLKSERKKEEADALSGMQEAYDSFVEDLKDQYQMASAEIKQLRAELKTLKEDYATLQTQYEKLNQDYITLQGKYTKLKEEVANSEKKKTNKKSTVVS